MDKLPDRTILQEMFLKNNDLCREAIIAQQCFDILGLFVIMVDVKGKIIFLNKRAEEVLDCRGSDLTRQNFIGKLVTREERRRVRAALKNFFTEDNSTTINILYRIKTYKNEERIIDAQNTKILDDHKKVLGILVSGKDVTEYTVKRQNMQQDINLYRTLLNKMPEISVFVFNKDLRFVLAEGIEMKNIGFSRDDFKDRLLSEVSSNKIRKIWTPLFESVLNGEIVSTEYKIDNYNYLIRVSPLRDRNNTIHSGLAVVRNITGEKLSEKILKKSKEEAVKSGKAKIQFLARVSHEIRTPLNAIMGFTEQLLQTKLSVKQREYVGIIDNSSELLLSLVNDILLMSKIEANQLRFEKSPFRLSSKVNYINSAIALKAKQKKLEFDCEIDKRLNRVIKGDSFRLEQILMNMLTNAVKFTNRGMVKLICSLHDETRTKVLIKFEVTDTGIGIADKYLKDIFKHYRQSNSGRERKTEGIGLGLAICKNLIEMQDGSLSVSSQRGVGTTFSFIIPYQKGEEADISSFDSDTIDPGKLKDKKVLLVEDDSVNMLLARTILKKFSCSLDIAINGKQALEKLDSGKYDIILLDIHLPDINGVEVAKYLREDKKDSESRIIALTAEALKDDILKFEEAGIDDFIIKPFRESYLYRKMCEALRLSEKSSFKPKTEIILKNEIRPKPYNLFELKMMAENDSEFVDQTLEIFIENSENAVRSLRQFLKDKNWKQLGETAHRMLPSYRHLEVDAVIPKLVEIKSKTLINNDIINISKIVEETIIEIENLIPDLRKEITR